MSGLSSSQKDLGKKMGYNNESAFSQIINEKASCPKEFTKKLKVIVPNLNLDWLETGEGEMLKNGITQSISVDNNTSVKGNQNQINNTSTIDKAIDEISAQRKLVSKSQEQIDRLLTIIE